MTTPNVQVQQPPAGAGGPSPMMKKGGRVKSKAKSDSKSSSKSSAKETVKGWGIARGARKAKMY
jgi:hypothetical protein